MAVTTPNAAPAESMFMTAAVSGIAMLRNTAISSRKLSSTTTPMNSGSLRESTWLKSSKIAVWPPVSTVRPLPRVGGRHDVIADRVQQVGGRGVLRRALRIDVGDRDVGLGRSVPGMKLGRVAPTTPGARATACSTATNAARWPGERTCATSSSGPL